jgi:N-acetylmuramic acid 6-phosphate etherase
MVQLNDLTTEVRNGRTAELDRMSMLEIVTAMNEEDAGVASAVRAVLPEVAQAAAWARDASLAGGRLIYLGAGTSGRLGVLDAAECPPTFGVPEKETPAAVGGWSEIAVKVTDAVAELPSMPVAVTETV